MDNLVQRLYADRDHQAQGKHYLRHISAMTGEGLHAKSAIAGELAHRDMEIERLRAELAERNILTYCGCGDQFTKDDPGTCGNCRAAIDAAMATPPVAS